MKRLIASASLIAAIISFGTASSYAFQSRQIATLSAGVTTGGVKMSSFTLTVHNVANNLQTGSIAWSNVDPAITSWKLADQYLRLGWNVTDVNGGIQIYTNNLAAAGTVADPRFVDPSPTVTFNPDSNPAGLLYVSGSTGTSQALPMAWTIKDRVQLSTEIAAGDPNNGPATGPGNKWQWLFVLDRNTPAIDRNGDNDVNDVGIDSTGFTNGDPYVTMVKQSGIHFSQGPTEFGSDLDKVSFVYLQAEFSGAIVQSQYRTSRLTVEAFIE